MSYVFVPGANSSERTDGYGCGGASDGIGGATAGVTAPRIRIAEPAATAPGIGPATVGV